MNDKIVKDTIDEVAIYGFDLEISQADLPYDASVANRQPSEKAFTICADRLVVKGNLLNPGRGLTLIARELIVDSGAIFDAGGPSAEKDFAPHDLPVQSNTSFAAKGANGANSSKALLAGKLNIFAEHIAVGVNKPHKNSELLPLSDWLSSTVSAISKDQRTNTKLSNQPIKGLFLEFKLFQKMRGDLKNTVINGLQNWRPANARLNNETQGIDLDVHFPKLSLTGDFDFSNTLLKFSSTNFSAHARLSLLVKPGEHEHIYQAGNALMLLDSGVKLDVKQLGEVTMLPEAQHVLTAALGKIVEKTLAVGIESAINKRLKDGNLFLLSQGGRGGRGQDGHKGMPGEKGTDGVKTNMHGQMSKQGTIISVPDIARGKDGSQGGQAGSSGRSQDGSEGGQINLGMIKPASGAVVLSVAGGQGADAATPGAPGAGGKGGWGAELIFNIWADLGNRKEVGTAPNGQDGPAGKLAEFKGNIGKNGDDGLAFVNSLALQKAKTFKQAPYSAIANKYPLTLLQITQNQADLLYLNAQTEADFAKANTLYLWLANITASFNNKPSATGTGLAAKDIAVRKQLNKNANLELSRMALGLDYFGHAVNWVPVLSLNALQTRVKSLLDIGKIVEDTYNKYQKKNAKVATRLDHLDHMRSSLEKAIKRDQGEIRDLAEHLEDAFDKVIQSLDAANAQRDLILQSEFDYKKAFIDYTIKQNLECTFEDILTTLLDVALFSAEIVSGLGQIKEIAKAANVFKGTDALIKVLKVAKSTEKSISGVLKSFNEMHDLNQGQGKIVLEKKEFDDLISDYLGKFPEADQLHDLVYQYFDLIEAHNNLALGYTALWVSRLRLVNEVAQKQAELQHIAALRSKQHQAILPEHSAFMERAYWHVKSSLIRKLYDFNRAYNFWSLKQRPFTVDNTSIAHMADTYVSWSDDIDKYLSRKGPYQPFQETITITPKSHPSAFQTLHTSQRLNFRLDINRQRRTSFANMSHIVATKVSIELPDLQTESGVAFLTLMHSGTSDMNSIARKTKPGGVLSFAHAAREIPYKIDYGNPKNTAGGLIGDKDQGFWGLSPFTVWELSFDNQGNSWINLESIKRVKLTFEGYFLLGK